MNRLKIAFVGTTDYPIPAVRGGAIQTLVTALLEENELQKKFDFTVLTVEDSLLEEAQKKYNYSQIVPIRITLFEKIRLLSRKLIRRITKNKIEFKSSYMQKVNTVLSKEQFDVVVFESTYNEVVQIDTTINTIYAYHVHADYLSNSTDRISVICQKCDYFICISDFIKSQLDKISAMDANQTLVLKNAVKIEKFNNEYFNETRAKIREKYGIEDDEMVIVYCGRLSKEKGCLELIKAFKKLNRGTLLIVGGENFNSNKTTSYVKEIKETVTSINNKVIFTGHIPHAEVYDYYMASDIGVVPSICNEAASLALVEFRNAGLLTVATNIGGIPEFSDPQTTELVDFDDLFVENLAEAIKRQMERFKEYNRENTTADMERYGYKKYYDNFCELINTIKNC